MCSSQLQSFLIYMDLPDGKLFRILKLSYDMPQYIHVPTMPLL